MKWWDIHKGWFLSETTELSSNSCYEQKHLVRNNLLVSTGDIVLRQNQVDRFPILIVYSEATPYQPPKVFLLETALDRPTLDGIAADHFHEVHTYVKDKVKCYVHRHQGVDGSLCIVESDSLYQESPEIFSIDQILDRIRQWFRGVKTGVFPPDSAEVELFHHFTNLDHSIEFLLTEAFYTSDIVTGTFFALTHKFWDSFATSCYTGMILVGEGQDGVSRPPLASDINSPLFPEIPEVIDLLDKGIAVGERERVISGFWWDIPNELKPFSTVNQLASEIGCGDEATGLRTMKDALKEPLLRAQERIYLGIRYPNRKAGKEWQIFVLVRPEATCGVVLGEEQDLLTSYEVKAIRTSEFTDRSFYMRNEGRVNRDLLKDKEVAVIGCGSVGSEIIDIISKAGVGKLCLVDHDFLRPHNLVRHLSDMSAVGQPKVVALHRNIMMRTPFVDVRPVPFNIFNTDIESWLKNASVGVSSIADDNIEAYLNQEAVRLGKPVFYVRALRGGKAVRIFRVIPGLDACKHCLSLYFQDHDELLPIIPPDVDLPTITNECNNPVRPASAADLKLAAVMASQKVLEWLEKRSSEINHWVWTSETIEGLDWTRDNPYSLQSFSIPPHQDCCICRGLISPRVKVYQNALDFMIGEVRSAGKNETGGILIGTITDKEIVVRKASGPGPKAIRSPAKFLRDTEYCQAFLDDQEKKNGVDGVYVGEWHYHPAGSNKPSETDLRSLSEIARENRYKTDLPVMIIFDKDGNASCTLHPNQQKYAFVDYELKLGEDLK